MLDTLKMTRWQEEENVAVEERVEEQPKIVVYNDDVNTFDWVIQTLVEICDMNESQAEQCSLIVHFKGKCVVAEGEYEDLKPKCSAITDRGIQATIEQLANQ